MSPATTKDKDKIARRRVPDALRRRTLVSCDRCKTRRVRCVRTAQEETCNSCIAAGVKCESNLPRKHRVYGSAESFSVRYRCLDALISGLFPQDDTQDIEVLYALARVKHIPMPSPEEEAIAPEAFPDTVGSATHKVAPSPASTLWTAIGSTAVQAENHHDSDLLEERLVAAPHGIAHYVGFSSTFEFTNFCRRLVAKYNAVSSETRTRVSHRSKMRERWAQVPISRALENRSKEDASPLLRDTSQGSEAEASGPSRSTTPAPPPTTSSRPQKASGATPTKAKRRWLVEILPVRSQADALVTAFFERVHPNYLLFHRAIFQVNYESLWHDNPGQSSPELGWVSSLFMMMGFGSQVLEPQGFPEAGRIQRKYLSQVREQYQHLAFTACLANVQALLLLQLYEHNAGERNTAWMLLNQAARMAVALGMHREFGSHAFDPIERNTRRMVWWTLYTFDLKVSSILGRPLCLDPKEVSTKLVDEQIIDGGDYPPGYMVHSMALTLISSRVKSFMSTVYKKHLNEDELLPTCEKAEQLMIELATWKSQLPRHLHPSWQFIIPRQRRAVILLHVYHSHIRTVISRPYLLARVNRDIESQSIESPGRLAIDPAIHSLSQDCRFSAKDAADNIEQLAVVNMLEPVLWLDFFYLQHAMLVMSLAFLGQRQDLGQESAMDTAHRASVTSLIRLCQTYKLAPTYSILCRVAISFANIVGIDTDDVSSQDEDEQQHVTESRMETHHIPPYQQMQQQMQTQLSQQTFFSPTASTQQPSGFLPEFFSDWYAFGPDATMSNTGPNDLHWDFDFFGGNDFYSDSPMQQLPTPYSGSFSERMLMGNDERTTWNT